MNVNKGDLAMTVHPSKFAGATCEVLYRSPPELEARWSHLGPMWVVQYPRPMSWETMNPECNPCIGAIPDAHLRCIAGPTVQDTIETNLKEPA